MSKVVCQIVKVRSETLEEYKEDEALTYVHPIQIHANVWPSVLRTIEQANIKDYTIHHSPQFDLLIARFTYVGSDWEGDMRRISEDPDTRRWWELTDGMQQSLVDGATGSAGEKGWWTELEEVFRFEGR
ncbi:BQ2448_2866 [Microbotryum intermedium]|uniref:BQ2448_2866 protein n=1 Tax=Microbotryum intermedium TaxID=269621 RepID=A0A238FJC4_9BASI|nr:BQ2448_2866 [Microbotryum intermedium]